MRNASPKVWLALVLAIVFSLLLVNWLAINNHQKNGRNSTTTDTEAESIEAVQQLLAANQNMEALRICKRLLNDQPANPITLLCTGEAETKLGNLDQAIEYYKQVPEISPLHAAEANFAIGRIYQRFGYPTASIDFYEKSIRQNPKHYMARENLISLLSICGRRTEVIPHAMFLLRSERATPQLLVELGNTWSDAYPWSELQRFRQAAPNDVASLLPFAQRAFQNGELKQAQDLLNQYLLQQPSILEAHALQGSIWTITQPDQFMQWEANLPDNADNHADIWLTRSKFFEHYGDAKATLRCTAEAVRLNPNHAMAHADLARLLSSVNFNNSELITSLTRRATLLQEFQQTIDRLRWNENYEADVRQAAETSLELNRIWEALGWSGYGLSLNASAEWPGTIITATSSLVGVDAQMPLTLSPGKLLRDASWLEDYPLPTQLLSIPPSTGPKRSQLVDRADPSEPRWSNVRFAEIAAQSGANFTYKSSMEDRNSGRRMFEFTGAGVGVIDFDADGLEEFFLPQGTSWPIPIEPTRDGDRLFRNLGNNANSFPLFKDCSLTAGIVEAGYGQGITISDINGDGFDDVYVANVNRNQLWINMGDGTFTDGQSFFPSGHDPFWTTSTIAIDINGDGLPDLLDVNYATGTELDTLRCDVEGKPRVCPPLVFQPAPIELWISQGFGKFRRHEWQNGQRLTAHGLGAIGFSSSNNDTPKVFLAVDQQANKLLNFKATPNSTKLEVIESAVISGIAYDHNGRAQACMGIAAGDITGNGEIDIFVTNFYEETNTLYVQKDSLFTDQTIRSGLAAPSRPMLGFGTQMLDIDLDGHLDIVVLNGHIDDFTHVGIQEKMVPQIFMQDGTQKFVQLTGETTGNFFAKPALGRALAYCDVNRDGRPDLLCTDLEQPFSVLLNQSTPQSDYVTIRLVGTTSERSGSLSKVSLASENFQLSQQLISGGGYMASNSRILQFAVPRPSGAFPISAVVRWPSGREERFPSITVNQANLLIEGRGEDLE